MVYFPGSHFETSTVNVRTDPELRFPEVITLPFASDTKTKKRRKRRYTDEQLFLLWQEGYTDEQIGHAVGVSRQYIQRWRDQLELPSTSKFCVNTQKYRLTRLQDGTPIVIISE